MVAVESGMGLNPSVENYFNSKIEPNFLYQLLCLIKHIYDQAGVDHKQRYRSSHKATESDGHIVPYYINGCVQVTARDKNPGQYNLSTVCVIREQHNNSSEEK